MVIAGFGTVEGETPLDDVSGLLLPEVGTRAQLNVAEARNILIATLKYLTLPIPASDMPFSFGWVLDLHRDMFGDVWNWAGQLRTTERNIGPPAREVETRLFDLTLCLPHWTSDPILLRVARLHHQAVWIHPFLNGNGRWARMLANVYLKENGFLPTEWPEEAVGSTNPIREEYLNAIRTADRGNYEPLVELHTKYTPGMK